MRTKSVILIPVLMLSLTAGCRSSRERVLDEAFSRYKGNYILYVSKAVFRLYVFDRERRVVAEYRVAYGLNPDKKTKLYAGDNRTPEGSYRIVEILSMDAARDSDSYRKMSRINQVYFRARDGHFKYGKPRVDLGDNAYGPRYYLLDFPNKEDIRRYEQAVQQGKIPRLGDGPAQIGSGIAIHGNNDEESVGHPASSGCIRMFNNDIIELEKYIQVNTPVIISRR